MTLVEEALVATAWPRIVKRPDRLRVPPNLDDYDRVRAGFSWVEVPEADYGELATVDGALAYLTARRS